MVLYEDMQILHFSRYSLVGKAIQFLVADMDQSQGLNLVLHSNFLSSVESNLPY